MMRTKPRRQCPIGRVEALETRNLLSTASPTVAFVQFEPLTGRILVSYTGDAAGYHNASLTNPANYSLVRVSTNQKLPAHDPSRPGVGVILAPRFQVTGVTLSTPVAPGQPQSLIVSVDNNQPIKFGTYQFRINAAGITDNAGQPLDGAYSGVFPSGNGQPGSNFVANLTETHNTVLPAAPVTLPQRPPSPTETVPSKVFLPSTNQIRVRYLASKPAFFQLAGGNRIRLEALRFQYFPGLYQPPTVASSGGLRPRS